MKKKFVIKKYSEFQEIRKNCKNKITSKFTIYFKKNDYEYTRVGLIVGKKNGIAVIRNKIKRQVREILTKELDFKEKIDLIVVIKPTYNINEFSYNKEQLVSAIKYIKEFINE